MPALIDSGALLGVESLPLRKPQGDPSPAGPAARAPAPAAKPEAEKNGEVAASSGAVAQEEVPSRAERERLRREAQAHLEEIDSRLRNLRDELAHWAAVEARLGQTHAQQQQQPESLPGANLGPDLQSVSAAAGKALGRPARFRWIRSTLDPAQGSASDSEREAALLHNLEIARGCRIVLRCAAGDPGARGTAERLKAIFERAAWAVRGIEEISPSGTSPCRIGLATAVLPATRALTATYFAFTAAGIPIEPRLDPSLAWDEAVLTVF